MHRAACLVLCFTLTAGCRTAGERLPVTPLAEDAGPLPYAELLTRTRLQASSANEAFYLDRWLELEEEAKGLEQTARFLPKATEVPAKHREALTKDADLLGQEAAKLRVAAKAKDVKGSNEILQRINLKVRELRLEN